MSEHPYQTSVSEKPNPWQQAHCIKPTVDPEWFFETDKNNLAKTICNNCPLKTMCLDEALKQNHVDGVWGGLTADERKILKQYGDINQLKKRTN